jgi:hypothetical protein
MSLPAHLRKTSPGTGGGTGERDTKISAYLIATGQGCAERKRCTFRSSAVVRPRSEHAWRRCALPLLPSIEMGMRMHWLLSLAVIMLGRRSRIGSRFAAKRWTQKNSDAASNVYWGG